MFIQHWLSLILRETVALKRTQALNKQLKFAEITSHFFQTTEKGKYSRSGEQMMLNVALTGLQRKMYLVM